MKKTLQAWAIQRPNGNVDITSLRFPAKHCRKRFSLVERNKAWKQLYKLGYRCIKVRIEYED